jgi:hypothetical protein
MLARYEAVTASAIYIILCDGISYVMVNTNVSDTLAASVSTLNM